MTSLTAPSRAYVVALRAFAGAVTGIALVAAGNRVSHAISIWALHQGLVELYGDWLLPRGISWAMLGAVAGILLWFMFRRDAMLPAVVAAFMVPLVTLAAFTYMGGIDAGFSLFKPYLFETCVVMLTLPGIVYVLRKR